MWEQFFFELNLRNPNLMYAYCSHDFTRQLRQREREKRKKILQALTTYRVIKDDWKTLHMPSITLN